jgi:hypothetical protein
MDDEIDTNLPACTRHRLYISGICPRLYLSSADQSCRTRQTGSRCERRYNGRWPWLYLVIKRITLWDKFITHRQQSRCTPLSLLLELPQQRLDQHPARKTRLHRIHRANNRPCSRAGLPDRGLASKVLRFHTSFLCIRFITIGDCRLNKCHTNVHRRDMFRYFSPKLSDKWVECLQCVFFNDRLWFG